MDRPNVHTANNRLRDRGTCALTDGDQALAVFTPWKLRLLSSRLVLTSVLRISSIFTIVTTTLMY